MATKIPWTEESWNPVVGCTKIAKGCKNCYAEKMAWRLKCMEVYPYCELPYHAKRRPEFEVVTNKGWTGNVICNEKALEKPRHWRKPRKIFVCSMGDLFHEKVPYSFQVKVFQTMEIAEQHIFQVLTKRPEQMLEFTEKAYKESPEKPYLDNVWLGTSISTRNDMNKTEDIMWQIQAKVRYLSLEPLLEWVEVPPLEWIIVGCESGPKARLCSIGDIRDAVRQCKAANVPVFVKQIPINGKCSKKPSEWPEDLRIQEYPKQGRDE
jgi:protein gp37